MFIIQGGFVVLVSTFFTTEYTGKACFFIWICLIYFLFAGIAAILPSYQAKLFGARNMSINLGFVHIALVSFSYFVYFQSKCIRPASFLRTDLLSVNAFLSRD